MGWVVTSERELGRLEVLSRVVEGRMGVAHAAEVLGLSPCQVQRLLRTFRIEGAPALRHKARGRPSNGRMRDGVRDPALALVRESYADVGPTLAAEELAERRGLPVSRETARAGGWPRTGCGCRAGSGASSTSRGCVASAGASWSRSTARSTAGWRIAGRPARCWCSSTTPRAG